jgi:peptidoglycan hydrolase-like protein with peptidoglycan-binding domain
MANIVQSVGDRAVNRAEDVRSVQTLLNIYAQALGLAPLRPDGSAGKLTVDAIRLFQRRAVHLLAPDGRVDPGGRTWRALSGPSAMVQSAIALSARDLSGAGWWHANQAKFPNSSKVADLAPGFAAKVNAFLASLRAASASVEVSATRRSKVRAYLMHYSWKLSKGSIAAADVPAEPGCTMIWNHGDEAKSRRAAQEMVGLFGIVFQPSLTSRHIPGLAIDMSIGWSGTIRVRNAAGKQVPLSTPADESNTDLHAIGASYGVIKLLTDPPHWSDNGH